MTPLSPPELERYARHIVLPEVGGAGQQKLKRARVLLIGAGGIGSPAALYLAAAGVGTLGLVDDDTVALSNLQRQILFSSADVGRSKLDSAAERIADLNEGVAVEKHPLRIDAENGRRIVETYDLVLDGSDNFATRYAMADLCAAAGKPLVSAAVQRLSGQLTTLTPFSSRPDGTPCPTYRDLYPAPPPAGLVPSCAQAGILGVVTGILGTLGAAEAIKLVCGIGEPLIGRLLLVDVASMRFEEIRYRARAKASTSPRD